MRHQGPRVLYRRPGCNDDWHFNESCPRHPNVKAKGVEVSDAVQQREIGGDLCRTCAQIEVRGRVHRRDSWH